jgi:pimeloyl-ACP methyl ester carboxylesterase
MTKRQHHVIYVPGILDDIYHIQSCAVKLWRLFGVYGHCHVMPWAGPEDYTAKIQRLQAEIDDYLTRGHRVSLVGASAGASAVLNIYAEHPHDIAGVALICPKINHPETIRQSLYAANPAFQTSLALLQTNLSLKLTVASKGRVATYHSPKDGVVPFEDSRIPGVTEHALPALRHGLAITYAITLGLPGMLGRLKHLGDG